MKFWSFALVVAFSACSNAPPPASPVPLSTSVHANGVVEPAGEERLIIPQVTGRVEQVLVDEGDRVESGQLLAELENAEQGAQLMAAQADVQRLEAELARLQNGARPEEIRAARAASDEAGAIAQQAQAERVRRQHLAEKKLISQELLEDARTRAATAEAASERSKAQLDLLLAGARHEDIAAAQATLAAARAQAQRADAELEKTRIRAPIAGVVLKRVLNAGETVTALAPQPLATLGNLDRLHVRAEINELDISRVAMGAHATVTSDAFPGKEFAGRVIRIARRMGTRTILSDDPAQRRDAKTLEIMIELDPGAPLPIGLRVDVQIVAGVVGPPGLE
ncbi:MAG: efflux RND transporter periplasmic adaptor subunit, partial [Xanthomonadales bacterium]|nr:efflux RND transporter periplasmic adaptor subunit [Xanthomonadales bacterium]